MLQAFAIVRFRFRHVMMILSEEVRFSRRSPPEIADITPVLRCWRRHASAKDAADEPGGKAARIDGTYALLLRSRLPKTSTYGAVCDHRRKKPLLIITDVGYHRGRGRSPPASTTEWNSV